MGQLFDTIRGAVLSGQYLIGLHAAERLDERGIPDWQIVEGIDTGKMVLERPKDVPNPAVEVEQLLPGGTVVKVVWSWLAYHSIAKLVTVHYMDR